MMNKLKTLVLMQIRDRIDLSWLNDKKKSLRMILLSLFKFALVTALVYGILYACTIISLFYYSDLVNVMILVLTFSLFLSLISCTYELMKSLYFAEDNKVLITLPVNTNILFISKIIVFYIYEFKKSFSFIIPIIFASILSMISRGYVSPINLLYMWLIVPFIVSLPVIFGAIISIPTMYIYRFLKNNSIIEIVLAFVILISLVIVVIKLIDLIPSNIDLLNQWPTISKNIRLFLLGVEKNLVFMGNLTKALVGEKSQSLIYKIELITLVRFIILIIINMVGFISVYFLSRPIFFKMMSKNFENNKSNIKKKKNIKKNKYLTFVNKEFLINLRTIDISINYLLVYIIVPIMIFLLNKLYAAMDTKELGDNLIYTFNVLLICLPYLASNSLVATYYSREGRSGYMKKVKPVFAAYPLFAKLFFNIIFSIPSVIITSYIFGSLNNIGNNNIIYFSFAILLLHLAHMFYSAMIDVMNPQNEKYATTGNDVDNPNEKKSTIFAFVISFLYAIISYKLLSESKLFYNNLSVGMIKILLISLISFISILSLFIKRIKAFYYELQGK